MVQLIPGEVTALTCKFEAEIKGVASHSMIPHAAIDANFIGCSIVSQLYTLVSRNINPLEGATLAVCQLEGGKTASQISDVFKLNGNFRVTSMKAY